MDGLRGLAILLVLLFHYWQLSFVTFPLPGGRNLEPLQYGGFLGVELFFFVSGFCLFFPYARGKVATLRHFAYRRAIKIVPSYLLALFVFAFLITDLYPSTWEHGKLADLGLHLTFLHNLTAATHGSFNGVMWSLAVEVQFYVLFPLVAWAFRRRPIITAAVMVAISVAYRAWTRDGAGDDLGIWADMLPAFLDLFAFGMLAAWLVARMRERPLTVARLSVPLTILALLSVAAFWFMLKWVDVIRMDVPAGIWQSENRSYLAAIFCVLAVSSAFALPLWRAILSNRVLVFLSTISYNLYIWHQSIGVLIKNRGWIPSSTPTPTDDPTWRWTYLVVAVTASIIVATLITYLYERPLLRDGVRGTLRRIGTKMRRGGRSDRQVPAAGDPSSAGA